MDQKKNTVLPQLEVICLIPELCSMTRLPQLKVIAISTAKGTDIQGLNEEKSHIDKLSLMLILRTIRIGILAKEGYLLIHIVIYD